MIDEMKSLKEDYLKSLPIKATQIRKCIEAITHELGQDSKSTLWETLETLVHKTAGSSGTYGFYTISKLAFELEEKLNQKTICNCSPEQAAQLLNSWLIKFTQEITFLFQDIQTQKDQVA